MFGDATRAIDAADRALLIECMKASESKTVFRDPSRLSNLIDARAHHVALYLTEPTVTAREDAIGYVCVRLGSRIYNFPYYLACVFPDVEDLAQLDELVSPVRLSADNSFCLSGSSTSLKRVNSISDIDFCEYFRGSAVELVSCLQEKQVLSNQCLHLPQPIW